VRDGYEAIASLPYGMKLVVDRSDGSPFIKERRFATLHRPHEFRNWETRLRISQRLREIIETHDLEGADDHLSYNVKHDRKAVLNASLSMNTDLSERERRYAESIS